MLPGRRVWIGAAGIGVELVVVAAVALRVSPRLWVLALLIGAALIVYAILAGEPDTESRGGVRLASGGDGSGPVRGNVFGDHATVNVGQGPSDSPLVAQRRMLRVSIAELCGIYREHTEIHAEKLIEPYLGGWLRFKGDVVNVKRETLEEGYLVSAEANDAEDAVFATFVESAQAELPRLRRGETIEIVGRLSEVRGTWVGLTDCEFAD